MTTREIAIAKLQQLPDSLLQQVSDFIDFLIHRLQPSRVSPPPTASKTWAEWFEAVDRLSINQSDPAPDDDYQKLLLTKYRKQGLDL